jgi:hypothetical protein
LKAGPNILVKAGSDGRVVVSKFSVQGPDQQRTVSLRLDDVIRAVAELGATYPQVARLLIEAKTAEVLESRLAVDAMPRYGRTFTHDEIPPELRPDEDEPTVWERIKIASPLPSLFGGKSDDSPR